MPCYILLYVPDTLHPNCLPGSPWSARRWRPSASVSSRSENRSPLRRNHREWVPVVRSEQDWWTLGALFFLNKNATLTAGCGNFANVLNTVEKKGWALQLKYEF